MFLTLACYTNGMAITLPVSTSTLENWRDDELASYEDHGRGAYPDGTEHVHAILGRARTRIVIETDAELRRLIDAAEYRAPQHWDDRPAYRAAVARIAARLRALPHSA